MTNRIKIMVENLPECEVFYDIGCDHGYCTKLMLDKSKCKRAIVSDVSEKCLNKAIKLLCDYQEQGRVTAYVCDGFSEKASCDLAFIAGMGGMEIISILKNAQTLPRYLALQPMKNQVELRQFVLGLNYKFLKDTTFSDKGKFYHFILLEKGKDSLTEQELKYGRDNINGDNPQFREYLKLQIEKLSRYAKNKGISTADQEKIFNQIEDMQKYV